MCMREDETTILDNDLGQKLESFESLTKRCR
jgi:hypothetical protein